MIPAAGAAGILSFANHLTFVDVVLELM